MTTDSQICPQFQLISESPRQPCYSSVLGNIQKRWISYINTNPKGKHVPGNRLAIKSEALASAPLTQDLLFPKHLCLTKLG